MATTLVDYYNTALHMEHTPTYEIGMQTSKFNKILSKCGLAAKTSISQALNFCTFVSTKHGIYSNMEMIAAGFQYTGEGDTAICKDCGLKLSGWTLDTKPFTRHAKERPNCAFVSILLPQASVIPCESAPMVSMDNHSTALPRIENEEQVDSNTSLKPLAEANIVKEGRKRSYGHWPKQAKPSTSQMVQAGFFSCNVGDRVICIYCNLICQQWTPDGTDPYELHKTLSPHCPLVLSLLNMSQPKNLLIVNEHANNNNAQTNPSNDSFRWHEVVATAACNQNYIEIPKREASFTTWPKKNLPSVESLVRAGFFYTGSKTIVTCFYCNGSLQNWGANDNPMIEHARWFPHCSYAKQLCGDDLYRKIQETKKAQKQDKNQTNGSANPLSGINSKGGLHVPDESTLSRLVAARLDLRCSQRLLEKNFKLSVIKRCWEDQLRFKRDDFQYVSDLLIACIILQKQIDHIGGNKEKLTVPSIAMNRIRDQLRAEAAKLETERIATSRTSNETHHDTEMSSSTESMSTSSTSENCSLENSTNRQSDSKQPPNATNSSNDNICLLCMEDQKRLACIPCGHLATCVPCGHSLRSCPVCRRDIQAFVRIYL